MTKNHTTISNRIRHHAVTVAAWFLVLLALGVAGLWADRRHGMVVRCFQQVRAPGTDYAIAAASGEGVLIVSFTRSDSVFECSDPNYAPPAEFDVERFEIGRTNKYWRYPFEPFETPGPPIGSFAAVSNRMVDNYPRSYASAVVFPHWFLLLLLLPWPAMRGWGWLKLRRRRLKGLCVNCGYDLRASPERCPECGTARSGNAEIRNSNDERMPKHE